jgi:hypothetical protein
VPLTRNTVSNPQPVQDNVDPILKRAIDELPKQSRFRPVTAHDETLSSPAPEPAPEPAPNARPTPLPNWQKLAFYAAGAVGLLIAGVFAGGQIVSRSQYDAQSGTPATTTATQDTPGRSNAGSAAPTGNGRGILV